MAKFTQKPINKTNVIIDDWLALKPYDTPTEHDRYYLGIAETIFLELNKNEERVHYYDIDKAHLREWACVLTSYFEDYISNIGLWRTFVLNNKELHGVYLPFYDLSNYKFDELNKEDIMYLCWHYLSKLHEDWLFSPDYSWFKEIAHELYSLFDSEQYEAYNTDFYETYFTIPDKSNFFETKEKLHWLALESYLLGLENQRAYKKLEAEALKTIKESNGEYSIDAVGAFLYSMKNDYLYTDRSSFNALPIPVWLAKLANCSEEKRKEIEELQYPHKGLYQYLSQDKTSLYVKELKNDKTYNICNKSAKFPKKIDPSDYIDTTLVKWDKEWWVTGMFMNTAKTEKEITQYLNSTTKNSWILDEEFLQKDKENTANYNNHFLAYFGANYIIAKNRDEAEKQVNEFSDFYRRKVNPESEKRQDVKLTQFDKNTQNIAIFVDSGGLKIDTNVFYLIELAKLKKFSDEEIEQNFLEIFKDCSSIELFCELLDKHKPKIFNRFPKHSEISILENKEFLFRMFNPDNIAYSKYPFIIYPVKNS